MSREQTSSKVNSLIPKYKDTIQISTNNEILEGCKNIHNDLFLRKCHVLKKLTDDLNKDTSQSNIKYHYFNGSVSSCHFWVSFPKD